MLPNQRSLRSGPDASPQNRTTIVRPHSRREALLRFSRAIAIVGMGGLLASCDQGTPLGGPFVIGPTSALITFPTPPITPAGVARAICLHFNPPGESRAASRVVAVLLTSTGERDTLRGRLDRTGEASVCLRDTSVVAPTHTYTGAEFTAAVPIAEIHRIYWGAPRVRP